MASTSNNDNHDSQNLHYTAAVPDNHQTGLSVLIAAVDRVATPPHNFIHHQRQSPQQHQQRIMLPHHPQQATQNPTPMVVTPDNSQMIAATRPIIQRAVVGHPRQIWNSNNNHSLPLQNRQLHYVPTVQNKITPKRLPVVGLQQQQQQQQQATNKMFNIKLHRSSMQVPWGITLSKLDHNYLIIGYARQDHKYKIRSGDVIQIINGQSVVGKSLSTIVEQEIRYKLQLDLWIQRDMTLPFPNNTTRPEASYLVARQAYEYLLLQRQKQRQQHQQSITRTLQQKPKIKPTLPHFRNPLFRDSKEQCLIYDDDYAFIVDDGSRANLFLPPIRPNLQTWLQNRKATWRAKWRGQLSKYVHSDDEDDDEDSHYNTNRDFWSVQGFSSFEEWRATRSHSWKQSYSWNLRKRKRLEEASMVWRYEGGGGEFLDKDHNHKNASTASTITPATREEFQDWLRVRKRQWNVLRRKRQRQQQKTSSSTCCTTITQNDEMLLIDAVLEEQERKRQKICATFDLSFVFDASLGTPDDVVFTIFSFLSFREQTSLLVLNKKRRSLLHQRDMLWRQLCLVQTHWTLPRRPRKPWHLFYVTKMAQDVRDAQKRFDEILLKAVRILRKGDFLQSIQKLLKTARGFDVNYVSGVVCERNSLLNLAIIQGGRTKVAKWLVEECGADLESTDRGGFTPLLNAVYDGHASLVRYLLSKGCNRHAKGTQHSTKPLAPPDFEGLTAKEWALKQGHDSIAHLLHVGL